MQIRLHDTAVAACINQCTDEGTVAGLEKATKLVALVDFLEILKDQFNLTLPIEDLRTATIDEAREAAAAEQYAQEERRFSDAVSYLVEKIVVRGPLWVLLGRTKDIDLHSHVCEIPWKHGLSALAVYTDDTLTRYLTVWWIGPSEEIDQVIENTNISQFL